MDTSHLNALELRLSHERERYARNPSPLRAVWISQIEREIAAEYKFLGLSAPIYQDISDEELMAELGIACGA